jgi:hypothetical protein
MYNLYPPFTQLRIALFHPLDVLFGIFRIYQGENHIFYDKPPFIVVQGAPDLFVFKDYELGFHLVSSDIFKVTG